MALDVRSDLLTPAARLMGRIPPARVASGVELGLVALIAWICAQMLWTFAAPVDDPAAVPSPVARANVAVLPSSSVPSFDPFHRKTASAAEEDSVDVAADAPETALDLKLYGVRALDDPRGGSAIIRNPDHDQGAFRVGMEVLKGVTLVGVFPDRVVLSRGGALESLFLDGEAPRDARPAPEPLTASDAAPAPRTRAARVAPAAAPGSAAAPEAAVMAARSGGGEITARSALRSLGLKPRLNDGRFDGVYIQPSGNDTLLKQFGLGSGDVIVEVNGVRLNSPQRLGMVLERLEDDRQVDLLVERGGSEEAVSIDTSGLAL